ncbi:MAG: carbonate dehydratase [Deltaproteobacteria bacterium RBG_16_71_12]|nr:MAG: carbonate dehydratase [Deltaproteobacteria bacterium RBG_16_71_12]
MARLRNLVAGYRRFRKTGWQHQRERWSQLAQGQSPKVMVIACSDSRVDPTRIFDTDPGELFIVRNIAALVPPCEPDDGRHGVAAAVEFAVTQLEVEEVLVLGHGSCAGCAAALNRSFAGTLPGDGGSMSRWLQILDDAGDAVRARHRGALDSTAYSDMEHEAVRVSLANLRTFPWLAERERTGQVKLHGGFFAIADGELHLLDEASGRFVPV